MIDYSGIGCSIDFIKSQGGICVLDTQQDSSMDFGLHDNIYQEIFSFVNGYEFFEAINAKEEITQKVILITGGIDQILLHSHQKFIDRFLDSGGILLSFAPNFIDWLPGNSLYIASEIPIKDRKILTCEHPITKGVKDYDITYRRGVCGFFSRGYFKPPLGAEVFLKDNANECVGYIDFHSTKGVILSTAGADLFGYGLFEQSTAKRLGLNLLLWIERVLKERG